MAWERSGVPGGAQIRTSWFDRDVPAMWRALENQQSDDHWRLVAGWRKASELTATHLRRLEHYRANLAEVWPPDRNAAAAAYVARLDFLIQNVRTTHEVAAANYSTLAVTVGALAAARRDLKPLHDEYVAKARAIREHADLTTFNAAAEAPTVIGAAPAGSQDLERLNNRARAIMYSLSHTLVEAEAAIRQPPTYESRPYLDQGDSDIYGQGRPGGAALASSGSNSIQRTLGDRPVSLDTRPTSTSPRSASPSGDFAGFVPTPTPSTRGPDTPGIPSQVHRGGNAEYLRAGTQKVPPHLAAGGVIGGHPATSKLPPTEPPRRINPIGGVINGQTANTMDARTTGVPPMFGVLGGIQDTRRRQPTNRQSPDTIWETSEGVPPVITPRQRSEFDPGPVIGLDR